MNKSDRINTIITCIETIARSPSENQKIEAAMKLDEMFGGKAQDTSRPAEPVAGPASFGDKSIFATDTIPVTCPHCKTEFQVAEKYSGTHGPCPKCKKPLYVGCEFCREPANNPTHDELPGKTWTCPYCHKTYTAQ